MPVKFTLQPKTYTKQMRKEFDHKRLNRVFVLWLYRSGQLDKYVREINLARASRGLIPHGFDIHHIVPLSGGGTNRLSNLCLIEKSLHKFINKNCFDPVLKDIKEGETITVPVPDFGRIAFRHQYSDWINKFYPKTKIIDKK